MTKKNQAVKPQFLMCITNIDTSFRNCKCDKKLFAIVETIIISDIAGIQWIRPNDLKTGLLSTGKPAGGWRLEGKVRVVYQVAE